MHAHLKLLPLLAVALLGPARAGDVPPPFTVEVDIRQEGALVNRTSLVMAPGETGSADMRREIPYALGSQEGSDEAVAASVDVSQRIRVTPTERDGRVALAADIHLSHLAGYTRESSGDRVVSIPRVSDVSLTVKDGAMTPDGAGWVYESGPLDDGLKVRIVARR